MTATIDPRIRERRIEVKREAGRRRLRITLLLASALVLLGTAYLAVESSILDVDHVRIEGMKNLDAATVERAAGIERGSALLRVDTGAVRSRVERLPWVADASVTRALPGTLRIEVREREPVAFVYRETNVALLDAGGMVVADAPAALPGLVELRGAQRVPVAGGRVSPANAAGVVRGVPPELSQRVAVVDVTAGMTLALHDGKEIRLCSPDDLEAKGAAAVAVMARLGSEPFTYIDVCVPQSPVSR